VKIIKYIIKYKNLDEESQVILLIIHQPVTLTCMPVLSNACKIWIIRKLELMSRFIPL